MKLLNLLATVGIITIIRYASKLAIAINDVKEAYRRREKEGRK